MDRMLAIDGIELIGINNRNLGMYPMCFYGVGSVIYFVNHVFL